MRKKVLILEDMETTRTALKRIVESCDDAITAYAFSEVGPALACMMENHIDLFFVDIILKPQVANDFSGIKFAEYVRQQEEYFGVDIIFVTSLIGLEAELLRKIHCYDYIKNQFKKVVSVRSSCRHSVKCTVQFWRMPSVLLEKIKFLTLCMKRILLCFPADIRSYILLRRMMS